MLLECFNITGSSFKFSIVIQKCRMIFRLVLRDTGAALFSVLFSISMYYYQMCSWLVKLNTIIIQYAHQSFPWDDLINIPSRHKFNRPPKRQTKLTPLRDQCEDIVISCRQIWNEHSWIDKLYYTILENEKPSKHKQKCQTLVLQKTVLLTLHSWFSVSINIPHMRQWKSPQDKMINFPRLYYY